MKFPCILGRMRTYEETMMPEDNWSPQGKFWSFMSSIWSLDEIIWAPKSLRSLVLPICHMKQKSPWVIPVQLCVHSYLVGLETSTPGVSVDNWAVSSQLPTVVLQNLFAVTYHIITCPLKFSGNRAQYSVIPLILSTFLISAKHEQFNPTFCIPEKHELCRWCHEVLLQAWDAAWIPWITAATTSMCWPWGNSSFCGYFGKNWFPSMLYSVQALFSNELSHSWFVAFGLWTFAFMAFSHCPTEKISL